MQGRDHSRIGTRTHARATLSARSLDPGNLEPWKTETEWKMEDRISRRRVQRLSELRFIRTKFQAAPPID